MNFKVEYNNYLEKVQKELEKYIDIKVSNIDGLIDAMKYSLLSGGKRLRPVLGLATCDILGGDIEEVLPFSCAVEMIHTYSLIHDDLPSMDDDDLRRGKPTNHKVFGEAKAILAGDALLNYAYEIMLRATLENEEVILQKAHAMRYIANGAGLNGMIGGQIIDLEAEGKQIDIDLLRKMHSMKTGELIKAPVVAASYICNANKEQFDALERYARNLGMAFQIKDDILDVEGKEEILGKPIGSDFENNKSNYISVYGIDEAKHILETITNDAISAINLFGEKGKFLKVLAEEMLKRDN
jgi:geranylgeranyl diphosphate synthase type II